MKPVFILLLLLPILAAAQVGPPCTPQLVISYDAAGNRIQRKDICDISSASTSGETGEGFRVGPGRDLALPATVTPNPGSVFLIQLPDDTEGQTQVEVFAPDGKRIRTAAFEGPTHKLDLRALPDGLYLLRLRSGGMVCEKKLLKRG